MGPSIAGRLWTATVLAVDLGLLLAHDLAGTPHYAAHEFDLRGGQLFSQLQGSVDGVLAPRLSVDPRLHLIDECADGFNMTAPHRRRVSKVMYDDIIRLLLGRRGTSFAVHVNKLPR